MCYVTKTEVVPCKKVDTHKYQTVYLLVKNKKKSLINLFLKHPAEQIKSMKNKQTEYLHERPSHKRQRAGLSHMLSK